MLKDGISGRSVFGLLRLLNSTDSADEILPSIFRKVYERFHDVGGGFGFIERSVEDSFGPSTARRNVTMLTTNFPHKLNDKLLKC